MSKEAQSGEVSPKSHHRTDDVELLLASGETIGVGLTCAATDEASSRTAFATVQSALGANAPLASIDRACALAYRRNKALCLYRDATGLRQLFWSRTATGGVAYGFEPCGLAPTYSGPRRISRPGLHEFLRLLEIAAPQTFIEAVHAVEPGMLVTLGSDGDVRQQQADTAGEWPAARNFDAAVDVLDGLLTRSVAQRLDHVRSAAAFLSGGVDSALLCAITARHRPDAAALTVAFEGERFDESPAAARIAAHLGLQHHVLRFSREDLLQAFDRLAQGMAQPMADPATMATLLAFEHCRRHFDAVLDGTGADEAVGAMPPRHVRLAVGVGSHVPAWLRRWLVRGMRRLPPLAGYTPLLDFEHPAETLMRWNGFTRQEIEEICGEPVSLEQTCFYRTFAQFRSNAHYERYSALLNVMTCDRLTQTMRLSGAPVRFPFCARDVDGFLRQQPTDWRFRPEQPKRILRELLARYVPRELWDGPKHGFDFPLHEFLAGDGYALVHQHVLQGRWLTRGVLRPAVAQRYARQYLSGDQRVIFRVWALVVLGAWLDRHEDLIA